jgi:hypothetical protein
MYLSAERLALANQTVLETFEQSSVVWQAIPHWYTGNPGQTQVSSDSLPPSAPLPITPLTLPFPVTVAEATAPGPEALLTEVIGATVILAAFVDWVVIQAIREKSTVSPTYDDSSADKILEMLITARAKVEQTGYRAPSCIFVGTKELITLSTTFAAAGYPGTDIVLGPANINSLHRVETLEPPPPPQPKATRLIFLGRRQRIAHGQAADASPGEEPVDLAVSVPPSLEVVGPNPNGTIALAVRVAGAVRVKDPNGIIALTDP